MASQASQRLASITTHLHGSHCAGNDGVLKGVKVVELATVIAAPTAGALMADMGADVIKVEPLAGDNWRVEGKGLNPGKEYGSLFLNANRGKKSVVLDIRTPSGLAGIKALIQTADVFITNVRQQSLEKQGLDYKSIHAEFPACIYAHLTAWGKGGPGENKPGYDIGAYWAATGMQDLVRPSDDAPAPRSPNGLGDHNTGMHLFTGITLALLHKAKTGQGQLVDASLLRSGVYGMTLPLLLAQTGEVGRKSARSHGSGLPNPTLKAYRTKDGELIQLLGLDTLRHMNGVLEALKMKEFCDGDERFDTPKKCRKNRTALIPLMDAAFEGKTLVEWEAILTAKDVWYTKAEKFENIWSDEQVNAVGTFDKVPVSPDDDVDWTDTRLIANPVKLSVGNNGVKGRAPLLGEHTIAELKRVGIDASGQTWAGLGNKK